MRFFLSGRSSEQKTEKKKRSKKKKRIHSAQKTIPYIQAFDNGIFEISKGRYSKSYLFTDINYQTARPEDRERAFTRYCELLNTFNSSVGVQITINLKSINKEKFREFILLKEKEDALKEYRDEYNQMLEDKMEIGRNNISREKYITLTIEAKDHDNAKEQLIRLEADQESGMKKIGSKIEPLELSARLEILHDVYRNGHEGEFSLNDATTHRRRGISGKDVIAPDGFEFKRDHFMMGDKFAQVLFLKDVPTFLTDQILTDLTDFNFNMTVSLHFVPIEPEKALRLVNQKLTGMEANKMQYQKKGLQSGYLEAFIPYSLRNALEEAQELLDDIVNKDQKLFLVSIYIMHIADDQTVLKTQTKTIESMIRKNLCQMGILNYQQEQGMHHALPFGINTHGVDRCFTTESTAVFAPFSSQELMQKDGIYYGLNAISQNIIMFNRLSLKTPSGFIFGTPGSGKSFFAKGEMISVLLRTEDDIIIIDPEREYTNLVRNFGGEVIPISAAAKNYINPLDISEAYGDDDNPLLLKTDFLFSLCESIIAGREGLSPTQKSLIGRCMNQTYLSMTNHNYAKEYTPTLKDFYEVLREQPESEAQSMATALELYTEGNLQVFSHHTNIDVNNRLICYDTKDLGKHLKTLGMLIVLDSVWNRVAANRAKGKRTWLYVDEMSVFFQSETLANFFDEIYRRYRKWGGVPTGITQNITPMMESSVARNMVSNSEFVVMLNQSYSDAEVLSEVLKISDTHMSYITNSDPGKGLLYAGGNIVQFYDKFPKHTQLYRMMTTKIEEISADRSETSWSL